MIIFSALRTADGIYFKTNIFKLKALYKRACGADKLSIGNRVGRAVAFKSELVKFSLSACLRLLISVTGGEIAKLYGQSVILKRVPAVPSGRRVIEESPFVEKVYISF